MLAACEIGRSSKTGHYITPRTPVHSSGAMEASTREAMLRAVPALRAFAMTLTGNADQADDLVQEALTRAIAALHSFTPGTNMVAWLMTILRNIFFTQWRKRRTAIQALAFSAPPQNKSHAEQLGNLELNDLRKALTLLPHEQREALMLVGAAGYSYDEAAAICGCVPGTVKSRVNRARTRLATIMQLDSTIEFGPARDEMAVVA